MRVIVVVSLVAAGGLGAWLLINEGERAAPRGDAPVAVPADIAAPRALAGGSGSVAGAVRFRGTPPPRVRLKMATDAYCNQHVLDDEEVMVNANGTLANVVVRVLGAPATSPPATAVTLTQSQCQYRPRVLAVVAGQPFEIKNGDPVLHNVHTYKGTSTLFNQAQVPGVREIEKKIATPGLLKLKCDVHAWMTGYVWVHENALFAITGADGTFKLDGVPAGRYTVEAWHERYGVKRVEVAVGSGGAVSATFEFSEADVAPR